MYITLNELAGSSMRNLPSFKKIEKTPEREEVQREHQKLEVEYRLFVKKELQGSQFHCNWKNQFCEFNFSRIESQASKNYQKT